MDEVPQQPDDRELVVRSQAGDTSAFEELVRRHQQGLFSYVYRMTADRHVAEEITQQALVRAWKAIAGFGGRSGFKTWLYRIGINLAINYRTRRRPTVELDENLPAGLDSEPQATFRQRERESAVQEALARLPADQRTAMVLSLYEQLSYKEIGEAMGRSARAVDSLLFRAKTNLRKLLEPARRKGVI
jgi:RNA polymerase sigma-70 factor (ECF subfamily)